MPLLRRLAIILCSLTLIPILAPSARADDESHSLIVYTAFFDPHQSSLSADDIAVLGMMADLTKGDATYEMRVVAYTDPVDEDKKDKDLAKARAEAVRGYMVGKGVAKERIATHARGDEESFGKDDSDTDRALRRRAEIRIRQLDRQKRAIDTEMEKSADTRVQTTVFFDFNKSDIKHEFDGLLDRLGKMLANNKSYKVRVFGHTDGVGKPDYNLALGNRRSDAVIGKLRAAGALETDSEKISMGEQETIGSQAMAATTSRALSRSVEIKVIKVMAEKSEAKAEEKAEKDKKEKSDKDDAKKEKGDKDKKKD